MPTDVELVLLKQLSSCLAIPMFVVGGDGDLVFFNEPAEPLVGLRFEESGELSIDEWAELLTSTDETGQPLNDDERPLLAALRRHEPVHRRFYLGNLKSEQRLVEATGIPLVSESGKMLGALGLFWQPDAAEPKQSQPPAAPSSGRQYEVEAILMRRLASYLATPIYLIGAEGQLLYFNPAAERVLGRRFDEMMASSRDELYGTFKPTKLDGTPIERGTHPLTVARERRQPAHLRFCHRIEGHVQTIEGTAFPLIGQSGRVLGAAGIFWEIGNT